MYKAKFILTNYIFLGIYLIEVVVCAPATDGPWEDEVSEETPFLEADVVLDSEVIPLKDLVTNGERNLVADPRRLWPNSTLLYELQGEVPASLRARLHTALAHLSQHSCVRFQPRRRQRPYLRVRFTGKGCFTKVGYPQQGGVPSLQVGSSRCWTLGTIQHEFLHALGFWHEHARPDRDQFITVLWDNVRPDRKRDFTKISYHDATNLGLPYDFASVMHYKPTAFGKVRGSSTLVSKKKEWSKFMGQRRGVTKVDIAKLNRLYNCHRDYYRGDDLEGVREVVGEVLEPVVRGNEEEKDSESSKQRREKKERRGKLMKKGDKGIKENSTLIKYIMHNGLSRSTGLSTANKYLEKINNNEDAKHNRVRRQMGEPKGRESKTVPEGEQQVSTHQESFAPQKILPELLKGVLNNDNNERPIVIQFAIYQPIVYKSGNESENGNENKSKQTNEQDTSQKSRSKNEDKYESNNRNRESETGNKGSIEARRVVVEEVNVEGENNRPPSRYHETRDEYYTEDKTYNRPSTTAGDSDERHSASSKDIQPLNVYHRKGADERTKDRPDLHDYDVREDRLRDHRGEYKPHEANVHYDHVTEETYVDSKHSPENKGHFEGPKKEYYPTYKPYTHEIGIEDTMTDKRDYLKIPTNQHEDEHYKTSSTSVDKTLHPDFSEDHAVFKGHFEELKPSRKNDHDNFKIENVSPFWNSGMSEDENIKHFKPSEVHEGPLSLSRDHVDDSATWKSDNSDREVIEKRVLDNINRPKVKHDLEIKETHTEELDRDIRRRKLEQERLKEITTTKPARSVVPEVTIDQLSTRTRDSEIDWKKTQINSKAKLPKRSQAYREDSAEDRREELGSDSEGLISKPNSAKLNLSPQQALPLNASALKSSSSARTVIRKVISTVSRE